MTQTVNQAGIISQQANAVKTAGTQKTLKDFVLQAKDQVAMCLPKISWFTIFCLPHC